LPLTVITSPILIHIKASLDGVVDSEKIADAVFKIVPETVPETVPEKIPENT